MIETLLENEWVSLKKIVAPEKGVKGYIFSHETRCNGRIIAVLPIRRQHDKLEYLLRSEVTPCWDIDNPTPSSITGGSDETDTRMDAIRELVEETGYIATVEELISLGTSYASKSADTVYHLYTVDLTDRVAGEALGDGSRLEAEAKAIWVSKDELVTCKDPQVAVMYLRLLNL